MFVANPDRAVEIEGMREFRKELKNLDRVLPRELAKVNKDAAEFVLGRAKARGTALGGVHAHAVKKGLRAKRSQRSVAVVLDADRERTILGAEFGAKRFPQFPPWRGNQHQIVGTNGVGYFLYPTIRDTREDFIEIYADAIDRLMRRAFPKVA